MNKAKRSISLTQPGLSKKPTSHKGFSNQRLSKKQRSPEPRPLAANPKNLLGRRRVVYFAPARGKTVDTVEFSAETGFNVISISFQDRTCLDFVIDAGFTVEAEYSDWKTSNYRPLRRWRPMRGESGIS